MSNIRNYLIKIILFVTIGALAWHLAIRYTKKSDCAALEDSCCHHNHAHNAHETSALSLDKKDTLSHTHDHTCSHHDQPPAHTHTNTLSTDHDSERITATDTAKQAHPHAKHTLQETHKSVTGEATEPSAPLADTHKSVPTALPDTITKISDTAQSRSITITNDITKKMLGYSHWTGVHTPTFFALTVNDIPLAQGEQKTIDIVNNQLAVSYHYSFRGGYKTGARTILFKLNPEKTNTSLTFSWKDKWHVICDNATPENAEIIPFKQ